MTTYTKELVRRDAQLVTASNDRDARNGTLSHIDKCIISQYPRVVWLDMAAYYPRVEAHEEGEHDTRPKANGRAEIVGQPRERCGLSQSRQHYASVSSVCA